jgi:hypothetical protein
MIKMSKLSAALLAGAFALAASLHTSRWSAPEAKAARGPQSHAPSACEEWKEALAKMPPSRKDKMEKDGAVLTPGFLLLSEDLAPDCELRGRMSSYFERVLDFHNGDDDRKFAAAHSKEIAGVLRRLWPTLGDSKALVGDITDPDAKYVLLADPAFEESDIAPLVSDILDAETISNGMGRIIFLRPLADERPALLRIMKNLDDPATNIMILMILNKMGEPSAVPKLKKLSRSPRLNETERKYAAAIVAKAERGEEIKFSDVEGLEYEDPRPPANATKLASSPPVPQ